MVRQAATSDDKEFWSRMYGREITDAELLEIKQNLVRFAKLLIEQARLLENDPQWQGLLSGMAGGKA